MNNELTLELNKNSELNISENTKNIFENISEAFDKAIDKGIDMFSLPDGLGESLKEGIKNFDYGELLTDVLSATLKQGMKKIGMKTSSFEDLVQIKDAIVEGNLKKGLSNVLDIVIDNVKLIPEGIKELVKGGKDKILGTTFDNEFNEIMEKQKSTLSRINKNCDKMEKAISQNDFKTVDKLEKSIKNDLIKIMPIGNVINRANSLLNMNELRKNKQADLTNEEVELCKKIV
jgi:hypothetical protein